MPLGDAVLRVVDVERPHLHRFPAEGGECPPDAGALPTGARRDGDRLQVHFGVSEEEQERDEVVGIRRFHVEDEWARHGARLPE